eukprot:9473973-Pyramimonas_sp.AAC.1
MSDVRVFHSPRAWETRAVGAQSGSLAEKNHQHKQRAYSSPRIPITIAATRPGTQEHCKTVR